MSAMKGERACEITIQVATFLTHSTQLFLRSAQLLLRSEGDQRVEEFVAKHCRVTEKR